MRQFINFRTSSEDGTPQKDAIVPYTNGEPVNETVMQRPTENLRYRTDKLRGTLRRLHTMADMINTEFFIDSLNFPHATFTGAAPGLGGTVVLSGGSLRICLYNTPGNDGASPPISSTPSHLAVGTFGNNQIIFTSTEAMYANPLFKTADVNAISVEITHTGGPVTVSVSGATGYQNRILVGIDSGTTTCQQVIDAVNGDVDASALVTAALEGTSTASNPAALWDETVWGGDYELAYLAGGVPAITHLISVANLASFFSAHTDNLMRVGDTVGIWYDEALELGSLGGRFQSLPENSNTVIPAGSFFNSRREPEKVPNSIPLFKCIEEQIVQCWNGMLLRYNANPQALAFTSFHDAVRESDVSSWVKINSGPIHNPPRTIKETLDNVDKALRQTDFFVTISDGSASTFGEINGPTALEEAITALNGTTNGGIIYAYGGNYGAGATFPPIDKKIKIIAVQDNVVVENNRGVGNYVFEIGPGGAGTVLDGITIQEDSTPSKYAVRFQAHDVHIIDCQIQGEVKIWDPGANNPLRTLIERTHIEGASTGLTDFALFMEDGDLTTVRNCTFSNGSQAYAVYYNSQGGGGISGGALMENCLIVSGDAQGALVTGNGAYGFKADKLTVLCQPFTDIAGSGIGGVVVVAGLHNRFESLEIKVNATGDIRLPVLKVGPTDMLDAMLKRVHIDLGNNYLKYSGATQQNPVQFRGDVRVENFHLTNFIIPNSDAGEGNFVLSLDEPIIRLSGLNSFERCVLREGLVDGFTAPDTATPNARIIGGLSSTYVFNDTGPFELVNFKFDMRGVSPANNIIIVVGGIGSKTIVRKCKFILGRVNSVIHAIGPDLREIDIVDNMIDAEGGSATTQGCITVFATGSPTAPTPYHCRIARNSLVTQGSPSSAQFIYVVGDSTLKGAQNQIQDNKVIMANTSSAGHTMIHYYDLTYTMISGNVTFKGNVGNNSFPLAVGTETGNVPLLASIGTLNVAA